MAARGTVGQVAHALIFLCSALMSWIVFSLAVSESYVCCLSLFAISWSRVSSPFCSSSKDSFPFLSVSNSCGVRHPKFARDPCAARARSFHLEAGDARLDIVPGGPRVRGMDQEADLLWLYATISVAVHSVEVGAAQLLRRPRKEAEGGWGGQHQTAPRSGRVTAIVHSPPQPISRCTSAGAQGWTPCPHHPGTEVLCKLLKRRSDSLAFILERTDPRQRSNLKHMGHTSSAEIRRPGAAGFKLGKAG